MFRRINKNKFYRYELLRAREKDYAKNKYSIFSIKEILEKKITEFLYVGAPEKKGEEKFFAIVGKDSNEDFWIAIGFVFSKKNDFDSIDFIEAFINPTIFLNSDFDIQRFTKWAPCNEKDGIPQTKGLRIIKTVEAVNEKQAFNNGRVIRNKKTLIKKFFHFVSCNLNYFILINTNLPYVLALLVESCQAKKQEENIQEEEIQFETTVENKFQDNIILIDKKPTKIEMENKETIPFKPFGQLTIEEKEFVAQDYENFVKGIKTINHTTFFDECLTRKKDFGFTPLSKFSCKPEGARKNNMWKKIRENINKKMGL